MARRALSSRLPLSPAFCLGIGVVLLLTIILGLGHVFRQPGRAESLLAALLKSLGAMGYVGLLLALMFYIYGVAGVHLFREADAGHFGSLKAALFSLFQVIALDNWSEIYRAATIDDELRLLERQIDSLKDQAAMERT